VLAEFSRHLDGCTNCVVFLAQYRETILLSRTVAEVPAPDLPEDLVQAVLNALKR
jgi:hypothetical protein